RGSRDLHPAGVDRIAIWIAAPRTVEGQRGELGPRRRRARDRDRRAIAAGGPEGDLLREWQVGESVEDNVVDVPAERRDSGEVGRPDAEAQDRKSTRLNSSHLGISYAVLCLKIKNLADE